MTTLDREAALRRLAEAGIPRAGKEVPLFPSAWNGRAFALVVALVEKGQLEWGAFQRRLVSHLNERQSSRGAQSDQEIDQHYFDSWLAATEETLLAEGFIRSDEIALQEKHIRDAVAHIRNTQTAV